MLRERLLRTPSTSTESTAAPSAHCFDENAEKYSRKYNWRQYRLLHFLGRLAHSLVYQGVLCSCSVGSGICTFLIPVNETQGGALYFSVEMGIVVANLVFVRMTYIRGKLMNEQNQLQSFCAFEVSSRLMKVFTIISLVLVLATLVVICYNAVELLTQPNLLAHQIKFILLGVAFLQEVIPLLVLVFWMECRRLRAAITKIKAAVVPSLSDIDSFGKTVAALREELLETGRQCQFYFWFIVVANSGLLLFEFYLLFFPGSVVQTFTTQAPILIVGCLGSCGVFYVVLYFPARVNYSLYRFGVRCTKPYTLMLKPEDQVQLSLWLAAEPLQFNFTGVTISTAFIGRLFAALLSAIFVALLRVVTSAHLCDCALHITAHTPPPRDRQNDTHASDTRTTTTHTYVRESLPISAMTML